MTSYDELLAEAKGDPYLALALACDRFDWTRQHVSAGLVRANTSHLKWTHKPPLTDDSTSDSWIKEGVASGE